MCQRPKWYSETLSSLGLLTVLYARINIRTGLDRSRITRMLIRALVAIMGFGLGIKKQQAYETSTLGKTFGRN